MNVSVSEWTEVVQRKPKTVVGEREEVSERGQSAEGGIRRNLFGHAA